MLSQDSGFGISRISGLELVGLGFRWLNTLNPKPETKPSILNPARVKMGKREGLPKVYSSWRPVLGLGFHPGERSQVPLHSCLKALGFRVAIWQYIGHVGVWFHGVYRVVVRIFSIWTCMVRPSAPKPYMRSSGIYSGWL